VAERAELPDGRVARFGDGPLTLSFLDELLTDAGFVNVGERLVARETAFPDLFGDCLAFEADSDFDVPHTLVVEAEKPDA